MCHLYILDLVNTCVKFPLDYVQPFWRRFFIGFQVNPTWLPNHVTYDVKCANLLFPWICGQMCKVSPRSVQPLQRRFLKIVFKKNNIAAESRDRLHHQFFFLWTILSRDGPQKFSYSSDVAFYICNYDVITKAPMTS